jgi:hypothetical protein
VLLVRGHNVNPALSAVSDTPNEFTPGPDGNSECGDGNKTRKIKCLILPVDFVERLHVLLGKSDEYINYFRVDKLGRSRSRSRSRLTDPEVRQL